MCNNVCNHAWLYTDYCKVCKHCGLEERVLNLDYFCKYSAPLNRGYDRSGRFKVKLDKLFGLHSGPKADDQVWIELHAVKDELQTPLDVRRKLRQFNIKNKHYDCCRIFCDTFTNFHVDVFEPIRLNKILLRKFENIHCSWRANTPFEPFFSYDYLLRYLLTEANCPLIAYCKPPTSRRRKNKYDAKLRLIQARRSYEM
jgi:hypothetical protein